MYFQFDSDYVARSACSVAMVVANAVQGDSRVIKTASTLSKLGYQVYLFGMNEYGCVKKLEGYPFFVELVAHPSVVMKENKQWFNADGSWNVSMFIDKLTDNIIESMAGRHFDILHTHDMYGLAIGAKLKKNVLNSSAKWVHDVHEYVDGCTHIAESIREEMLRQEREHIHKPDVLTTVSPILSDIISNNYGVANPFVVLNTPRLSDYDPWYPMPIRKSLGLESDVPLMVYNGCVKPERGVHYAVDALKLLPNVHLVLVTNNKGDYIDKLIERSKNIKAEGRLHIHKYVPNNEVTSFLRDVQVGLIPLTFYGNTDLCLPTKLFEYIHAGIPVVASSLTALSHFLDKHPCGFSFEEGNPISLASNVKKVLKDFPNGLPSVFGGSDLCFKYCWEEQEKVLSNIYDCVLNASKNRCNFSKLLGASVVHLPAFSANQPYTFANALRQINVDATSVSLANSQFKYECHEKIDSKKNTLESIKYYFETSGLNKYHIFHYHFRPLIYNKYFAFPTGIDLLFLKAMGKKVFFHFRGSEVRLGSVFKKMTPYNFVNEQNRWNDRKKPFVFNESGQVAFKNFVEGVSDGVFVNDPELQNYVPNSIIVPRVINCSEIITSTKFVKKRPLLVHAPSRRGVKGTEFVLAAIKKLLDEGYDFDFELVEDVSHAEAMEIYSKATIIIDQLRIGWYGVLAVEGMMLGKTVVSYIRHDLRHYLPYPAPLAIANPDNIVNVLRYLLDTPDALVYYGNAGREFVNNYHCAKKVSRVLCDIYSRPFRPINSVAVSNFLAWQSQSVSENYLHRLLLKKIKFHNLLRLFKDFFRYVRCHGLNKTVVKCFDKIIGRP